MAKRYLIFTLKPWLFVFLPLCFVAATWLVRTDSYVKLFTTDLLIRAESSIGVPLTPVRALFAIDLQPSSKELFERIDKEEIMMIGFLCNWGVQPNAIFEGISPLRYAIKNNKMKAAAQLLAKGADPDIVDDSGSYPLLEASKQGNVGAVQMLLTSKADSNVSAPDGRTALMYAAELDETAVSLLLLGAGADANAQDKNGRSPLAYAVLGEKMGNAKVLLGAGALTQVVDSEGRTVSDLVPEGSALASLFGIRPKDATGGGVTNLANQFAKVQAGATENSEQEQFAIPKEDLVPIDDRLNKANSNGGTSATSPSEEEVKEERKAFTRLRGLGRPVGTWKRGKDLVLEAIELKVRNVGSVTAENINVSVRIPDGSYILLLGPNELERYSTATYSATPKAKIRRNKKLKARLTCDNCYR